MLKIGLTGGIGCGKSTATTLFVELGVPVVDADIIARQLTDNGSPVLASLRATFGASIFMPDHSLNRNNLREMVFASPDKKQQLEAILHPLIYQQIEEFLAVQTTPYAIASIPLLMETQREGLFDRVLVVDCPRDMQISRAQLRSGYSRLQILAIINSQVTRQHRLTHASDVLDNAKSPQHLAQGVKKLHNRYLLLSN